LDKFDKILADSQIPRSYGYSFYFKNYIFNDVSIENKTILDLGGGNGIASFYALHKTKNCSAWIVDPIAEGSNQLMTDQYNTLKDKIDPARIHFHRDFIDTLQKPEYFDIILMHNSINHIGEDIIEHVESNKEHWDQYLTRLEPVILRAKKGAHIVIADCSNKNFWNDLGMRNPLAPNIDWNLHHRPQVWRRMLKELGCSHSETRWTARREFLAPGKFMLANRFFNYFLGSHFVSVYKKCS